MCSVFQVTAYLVMNVLSAINAGSMVLFEGLSAGFFAGACDACYRSETFVYCNSYCTVDDVSPSPSLSSEQRGKTFDSAYNLRRHKNVHDPELRPHVQPEKGIKQPTVKQPAPSTCSSLQGKYTRRDNLLLHQRAVHEQRRNQPPAPSTGPIPTASPSNPPLPVPPPVIAPLYAGMEAMAEDQEKLPGAARHHLAGL